MPSSRRCCGAPRSCCSLLFSVAEAMLLCWPLCQTTTASVAQFSSLAAPPELTRYSFFAPAKVQSFGRFLMTGILEPNSMAQSSTLGCGSSSAFRSLMCELG